MLEERKVAIMAKRGNDSIGKRSLSHASKPYDANNSFVKKVATKVTDFIPQRSWISKWFNASQDNGDTLGDVGNPEDVEAEDETQRSPPTKRPRVRADVTHPPGTFSIRPRAKLTPDNVDSSKERYPLHEGTEEDLESTSTITRTGASFVSSTPATRADIGLTSYPSIGSGTRSELNSAIAASSNGAANGTDDNSESSESTSGCSSLIQRPNRRDAPSNLTYDSPFSLGKRFMEDKSNLGNRLRSPRSLFLDTSNRDSLSSRRPSFNASVAMNTSDRSSPLASPFYTGNTTYGGANAAGLYKSSRTLLDSSSELQLKIPQRASVRVKPPNATAIDSSGMSQTARKILEALEHFSSPISDAKKIPVKGTDNSAPLSTGKKRSREEAESSKIGLRHLTRELHVPSVPDILKIRRRQKLQDTTVAARQIVSSHTETPTLPREYRLRSEEDETSGKYHGKIKSKSKANLEEEETVETVNLPDIQLPISSLPNFNFMMPQRKQETTNKTSTTMTPTTTTATPKTPPPPPPPTTTANEATFKFASPIKVTDTKKDLKSIDEFTFSKPISAKDGGTPRKDTSDRSTKQPSTGNFVWSGMSTAARPKEFKATSDTSDSNTRATIAEETKRDPKKDETKSTETLTKRDATSNAWECAECLLKNNNNENRCFGCKAHRSFDSGAKENAQSPSRSTVTDISEAKKPVPSTTESNDCFGSRFKLPSDNSTKIDDSRLIAAQTVSTNKGLEEFRPKASSWECPGCMLINSANVITCPCCNASKPLARAAPKKETASAASTSLSSECVTKADDSKASSTAGSAPEKIPSVPSTLPSNGFGDKFKKPEGAWNCDACFLQNDSKTTECVACGALKPGAQKTEAPVASTSTFKFGVDKAGNEESIKPMQTPSANGFKFGGLQKSDDAPKPFTFGVPKTESETPVREEKESAGFSFSSPSTSPFVFGATRPKASSDATATPSSTVTTTIAVSETASSPSTTLATISKPPPGLFTFGSSSNIATSSTSTSSVASLPSSTGGSSQLPSFSFSASKSSVESFGQTTQKPTPTRSTTAVSSATTFSFSAAKPIETTSRPPMKKPATGSLFPSATGETSSPFFSNETKSTAPQQSLKFGVVDSNKTSLPSSTAPSSTALPTVPGATPTPTAPVLSVFNVGATTKTQAPPTFGTTADDKNTAIAPPTFGGIEKKPCTFGQAEPPREVPTFGQPPVAAAAAAPPPPPVFGSSTNVTSVFGSSSTATPLFGSTGAAAGTGSNDNVSGSSVAGSTPGIFSTTKTIETTTPNPNLFAFGSSSSVQGSQQSGSGFDFSSNVGGTAQKPLFTFGSGGAPQTNVFGGGTAFSTGSSSVTGGFGFNAVPTQGPAAATKPDNAFGQTAAPIFGTPQSNQGQASTTAFSAAPASNGGFNFGSAASAPSSSSTSAFAFGGAASNTSTPSAGFNFNPPTRTPTVAFDPNTPPSFNFTGGSTPAAFSATPQPSVQRKIKKAVRRIR